MLFNLAHIDLPKLEALIRDRGRPVHINTLTRTAVFAWLEQNAQTRQYAPGATYEVGEIIQFNGRPATITAIQPGYNPKQGKFQILTPTFPDGRQKHMASGISGAPHVDRIEVTPDQVQKIVAEDGLMWRTAVHNALTTDNRFVTFQDEQGDQYCLMELLPMVTAVELQEAWVIIQTETTEIFSAVATENLGAALWGQENDGSDEYHLLAFALNLTLQEYREVHYLAGAGWMLAEHWRQAGQRPSLIGPRMANIVPEATDEEAEEEAEPAPGLEEVAPGFALDIEAWRQQRRNEAAFTLSASHYYGHWLPLNRQTERLFPQQPCHLTIYHRFGDREASFKAVLNPELKRILAEPAMYDAFYQNGIYPGARLTISHRGSDYDYDMRTQPTAGGQVVIVRRIALNREGQLDYWDDKEPLRYQVDGDVFVAAARWEDLPALFQQAEAAGQGIFGLMFQTCQRWQRERGLPLIVTVKELFEAIHFGERLTSSATIAFELWRRLAFVSVGQGRYQFQPEKGDRTRTLGLSDHGPEPSPTPQPARKTKSLAQLQPQTDLPISNSLPAADEVAPALRPPTFERTATGQLIAADLLPLGPLFNNEIEDEPISLPRGTRCFVFQQRHDSEYEDRIGRYYSWKERSPNSRQVQPGDLFIYYRPGEGEQVFFGTGQVDFIEKRGKAADGRSLHEATITNYEAWKPPLPLTSDLARRLQFIQTNVLGIGQAGIRRINRQDFQRLRRAYKAMKQGHPAISASSPSADEPSLPPSSIPTPHSSTTSRHSTASITKSPTKTMATPTKNSSSQRGAHDDGIG